MFRLWLKEKHIHIVSIREKHPKTQSKIVSLPSTIKNVKTLENKKFQALESSKEIPKITYSLSEKTPKLYHILSKTVKK